MNRQRCLIYLLTILVGVPAVVLEAGENIALGKKYVMSPAPNCQDCIDAGDATQLTDGQTTTKYFWTQPGTVGWRQASFAAITIDLEQVEPIDGASFRTAAGGARVEWPSAIFILTSDDGKTFRDNGDLAALDIKNHGPWPTGYAIRRLAAFDLHARGRFVRFVVPGQFYIFCDEVEIFRGSPKLLQGEPSGTPVPSDMAQFINHWKTRSGAQRRFEADIAAVKNAIDAATVVASATRTTLQDQWKKAGAALRASELPNGETFRAVLPYNEAHAQLFQVQAALWRAQGLASMAYGVPATWDPMDLISLPTTGGQIEVHTMRGEYRAASVNLVNASDMSTDVRLRFEGLPGSPTPKYVTVHEALWTDTFEGQPVVAALPSAKRNGPEWHLTVLPGLVRQVWLTFHVEQALPGDYAGKLIVESARNEPLQVPIRLHVYPLDFPRKTTLQQGGWDETNGNNRGVTSRNRKAFIEHLRNHFVNVTCATANTMMQCSFAADGKVTLHTQTMDDWLAQWPGAKMYHVFLAIGGWDSLGKPPQFYGAEPGTPEFDRKVRAWTSAWVGHMRTKGIPPEQLALHIFDEMNEKSDLSGYLAWAKAIRAAEPKVVIWENPSYQDLTKAPAALFDACDVLCPHRPTWLGNGESFAQFYRDQQRKGRTLHFYSCIGPAKLLDPYSYYRLQAWHCWQIGATGSFFWAFGDNRGISSWNEYLITVGPSYTPLFLDETTVTASKQMEAIREGAEDYEYFVLLRDAVRKAKAAGRSDAALTEAESLLAIAATEVLAAPNVKELCWHKSKDRTKADATRIQILQALMTLQERGG